MALIPAPSFELAQTRTVGAHGCWDYLAGVPASSNVGFALGVPRNGRARPKNGRGENSENSENRQASLEDADAKTSSAKLRSPRVLEPEQGQAQLRLLAG